MSTAADNTEGNPPSLQQDSAQSDRTRNRDTFSLDKPAVEQKLAERGGKNAKKRAVIVVARKLAVLLHKLWVSGEVYEPLRNNHKVVSAVA